MGLQNLGRVFLATLLTAASVAASPYPDSLSRIAARDLYVPIATTCKNLVVGATNIVVGQVCVGILDGTVTVSYTVTAAGDTLADVHVYLGLTAPTDRAPGHFGYQSPDAGCTIAANGLTATCSIPVKPEWRGCGVKLYIATHASLNTPTGGVTGFGDGTCFGGTGGNCAKYWTFLTQCQCRTTVIYEPVTSTTTSSTTWTTTSTTEYLTSSTSVTTITQTSSSVILYSTTSYDTFTITSSSILYSTSTPTPLTTVTTCINAGAGT